jgi:hypothetical protein
MCLTHSGLFGRGRRDLGLLQKLAGLAFELLGLFIKHLDPELAGLKLFAPTHTLLDRHLAHHFANSSSASLSLRPN